MWYRPEPPHISASAMSSFSTMSDDDITSCIDDESEAEENSEVSIIFINRVSDLDWLHAQYIYDGFLAFIWLAGWCVGEDVRPVSRGALLDEKGSGLEALLRLMSVIAEGKWQYHGSSSCRLAFTIRDFW